MGGRLGRTPPSEAVLDRLPIPAGTPSTTRGRTRLRAEARAVWDAIALARGPATGDNLADLHAAWKLLHGLDQWTLDPKYGPGTDLRTPAHRLMDRIAAPTPTPAAPLAATRDHPDAARVRAAAHAYLQHVLPLWPHTADWTDRARTAYLEQLHTLRTTTEGGPPPGRTKRRRRRCCAPCSPPLPEPSELSRHEAAALWRSHSGRGAEQAGWDTTVHTNRIDDLARAHALKGTPRHKGEAIAAAQRNLTAVTHHHACRALGAVDGGVAGAAGVDGTAAGAVGAAGAGVDMARRLLGRSRGRRASGGLHRGKRARPAPGGPSVGNASSTAGIMQDHSCLVSGYEFRWV
ncbi:hypothetical protein [Streptomyces sp. NPDC003719]